MMPRVLIYAACLLTTIIADICWLGLIARGFYRHQLGDLMAERVVWPAAIAFYFLHALGTTIFCALPGLQAHSVGRVVLTSLLFGLVTYGTYDLTNLATLRGWPPALVAVDMCWGMLITLASATAGYAIGSRLLS